MSMYERTQLLIGSEGIEILKSKHVAVFGVGGVGGYVVEALTRVGVGHFTIVDHDSVSESNINRQIIALTSTVGRKKVEVLAERMKDINPSVDVDARAMFYLPETADQIDFTGFDYVVDAVDNVTAKLDIIMKCREHNIPIISSMGTGSKLHPEMLRIADINETSICPLARVMRKECKKRGIGHLKCVYSKEPPITSDRPPGSVSFVPSSAGLLIASEVTRELLSTAAN